MVDFIGPLSYMIWIAFFYIIARLILHPRKRIITGILVLSPWLVIAIISLYYWFNWQPVPLMSRGIYFNLGVAPVLLFVSIVIMDIIWQYHNYSKQDDDIGTSIHLDSKKRLVFATLVVPVLLLISTTNILTWVSWVTFFGISNSTIAYLLEVLIPEIVVVLMLTTEIVSYLMNKRKSSN